MRRRKGPPQLARRRPEEAGQALLELALVTPILVLLVMAIFQFAFVLESQIGLENAVREAARRVAAANPPPTAPYWTLSDGPNSLEEWVDDQLCGDVIGTCDAGLLPQNVQGFDGSRLAAVLPTVKFCSYPVAAASGTVTEYRVKVSLTYSHPLFFAPMAAFTDAIDGFPGNNAWDMSVSAEMRLEKIDPSVTNFADPGACP